MKRFLMTTLMVLGLLFVALVSTVLMRADGQGLPAPDPSLPIQLSDGSTRPLSEVLDMVATGQPLPPARPLVTLEVPEADLDTLPPVERAARERLLEDLRSSIEAAMHGDEGSVFRLAEDARHAGRFDEAAALYLSIPADDPQYARSRRRLAWDVLTKGQSQPRRAVAYVNEAVARDPFNGNSWQDLARVYGATLGIQLD